MKSLLFFFFLFHLKSSSALSLPSSNNKKIISLERRKAISVLVGVFISGLVFGASAQASIGDSMWRRYGSVDDIPSSAFDKHVTITGIVSKITDGDTLKVQHQPLFRAAASTSLKIRLCAVDAPETAHFGNAGQPLGPVAKAFVAERLPEGRKVKIKLLSRDRYGRAVARITYRTGIFGLCTDDISEALLREGLATVYTGGGAQYDGPKQHWVTIEDRAKAKHIGIWSDPDANDPKAYKKKIRNT
mmetsp:Transcript_1022/g.1477  ORF Transcript_1022/g.1477 Transcript_1022/m.1477 type:complete len:245 (+) Transcript_1022:23-757(+)